MLLELDGGQALEADLLVAADGALSRVREMMGFHSREWDYGHRAIVATVEVAHPHEETAWQRFLPSGPLALLPLLRKGPGDAAVLFLGDANAGEMWPGYLPYCLSKLAVPRLAAGLRNALPPGVRVGVVRPGLVLPPDRFPAKRWERLLAEKTGRRGIRTPEGVARAVLRFARPGTYNPRTDHRPGGPR